MEVGHIEIVAAFRALRAVPMLRPPEWLAASASCAGGAGILARNIPSDDADMTARGYDKLDIVVCNLYPFQKRVADPSTTIEDAVEEVDIGAARRQQRPARRAAS